jgi:aryl carrier-like protein
MARQQPASGKPDMTNLADLTAAILEIWREVLSDGTLVSQDDFFAAGGDSIHAALIVSRMRRHLGVEVSLRSVLSDGSTAEDLARLVIREPRKA